MVDSEMPERNSIYPYSEQFVQRNNEDESVHRKYLSQDYFSLQGKPMTLQSTINDTKINSDLSNSNQSDTSSGSRDDISDSENNFIRANTYQKMSERAHLPNNENLSSESKTHSFENQLYTNDYKPEILTNKRDFSHLPTTVDSLSGTDI